MKGILAASERCATLPNDPGALQRFIGQI